MALGKVIVTTQAQGPGSFKDVEGLGLFIGDVTSGQGAVKDIGRDTDLLAMFGDTAGSEKSLTKTLIAARDNGGPNWKAKAYGHVASPQFIDAAAAVDKTGGKVGIPLTGHGIPVGVQITIAGTTNYNATYNVLTETTANEIVITATFTTETFGGTETVTWDSRWEDVIDAALVSADPEFIVICVPVTAGTELTTMQTKATGLYNAKQPLFFMAAFRGYLTGTDADWSAYLTAASAIPNGVAAGRVLLSPLMFGNEQGALAGRLQKVLDEATPRISRSPMRVASGAVVDPGAERKDLLDDASAVLSISNLESLDGDRISVFQWYASREGIYFADGNTLEATGGNLPVIEWLRILDQSERRIRQVATGDVSNDLVQNTPAGNAAFATRLAAPLRAMALLGEIKPLARNAVTVEWTALTKVKINYKITPPNAPKEITNNIILDTSG